jgi:hypothetical protein
MIQDRESQSPYIWVNTVNALLPDVNTLQTLIATQGIDQVVQVRPQLRVRYREGLQHTIFILQSQDLCNCLYPAQQQTQLQELVTNLKSPYIQQEAAKYHRCVFGLFAFSLIIQT